MEWQPIETAPKGVFVLVVEDDTVFLAGKDDDEKWYCSHTDFDGNPTHWMPLPTPPSGQKEG